jgi:hypothetical protein
MRYAAITPDRLTKDVVGMLRASFADPGKLPILADALTDAGYDDERFLARLRSDDPDTLSQYSDERDVLANALDSQVPEVLRGGSWAEVFSYAGEPGTGTNGTGPNVKPAHPTEEISLALFCRWDVAEVYGTSEGENDGKNWLAWGLLLDGRHFFISSGCDYTGWG